MTSESEYVLKAASDETQQRSPENVTIWRERGVEREGGAGGSTSSIVLMLLVDVLDVYVLPAIVVIGIACNLTAIAVYVTTPRVG